MEPNELTPETLPKFAREAVAYGIKNGLTAKETAEQTGWKLKTIQTVAARMKVAFRHPKGRGAHSKYPNKLPE